MRSGGSDFNHFPESLIFILTKNETDGLLPPTLSTPLGIERRVRSSKRFLLQLAMT